MIRSIGLLILGRDPNKSLLLLISHYPHTLPALARRVPIEVLTTIDVKS